MENSLSGRVALVTGNSAGLGKAIGKALGLAGAKVPVNFCHNQDRAEQTLKDYQMAGIETALVQADVTSGKGVDDCVEQIRTELGPIDILVPNATCDQPHRTIEDYDWQFYQQMIDFFIKSPFLLTKAVLAHMKQQKWGRIINITSEVFQDSVAPFSAYVAAKGGQVGWSRSMSRELGSIRRHRQHGCTGMDSGGTARKRSAGGQGCLLGYDPDETMGPA